MNVNNNLSLTFIDFDNNKVIVDFTFDEKELKKVKMITANVIDTREFIQGQSLTVGHCNI